MFQYATGAAVAQRQGRELRLDVRWYKGRLDRTYRLNRYNICAAIASQQDVSDLLGHSRRGITGYVWRWIQTRLPCHLRREIKERECFTFDPAIPRAVGSKYLNGYWQNPRYFSGIEDSLRTEFQLRDQKSPEICSWERQINNTEAISIHVRRGDYVGNSTHGTSPATYYREAVRIISQRCAHPHFYIFSDDTAWVRQNLNDIARFGPVTYVEGNQEVEDLFLMSRCQHHIIANSTFSWWGAWLNPRTDKIVIAPKQWLADRSTETTDLIPQHWIRL